MRRGVRIAVDVGDVRVGVAASDPHGLVATPVETVKAGRGDVRRIADLVAEREAIEVVVGLPRSLSGREGPAAAKARAFATRLAAAIAPVGVRLVDERLTTVTATRDLRASGVRGKKARTVVDQAAAVVILQNALETERASGRPPGQEVEAPTPPAGETEAPPAPTTRAEPGPSGTVGTTPGDTSPAAHAPTQAETTPDE
ncbi:MAG: Holliday junction resolvase RuvX [Streptomycetaceae bacterium]|nr:Holliday junction resolvase RuvX [Streptomycetaceae bacterium]